MDAEEESGDGQTRRRAPREWSSPKAMKHGAGPIELFFDPAFSSNYWILRFYSNQLGYWSASSYGVAILSQPAGDDIGFLGYLSASEDLLLAGISFRSAGRYGFGCSFRTKFFSVLLGCILCGSYESASPMAAACGSGN